MTLLLHARASVRSAVRAKSPGSQLVVVSGAPAFKASTALFMSAVTVDVVIDVHRGSALSPSFPVRLHPDFLVCNFFHRASSCSLEQRRLARREIDLSYLPDGELDSGLFIPPGERVTDGGEDTICEKVARGCLGVTDHDKRGFELHTDPTLQALKTVSPSCLSCGR